MSTRDTIMRVGRTLGAGALAGAALVALPACRGDRSDKPPRQFFPDLDDQLKWRPQGESPFYADGRMMRPAVRGTVAFGRVSFVNAPEWGRWADAERSDLLRVREHDETLGGAPLGERHHQGYDETRQCAHERRITGSGTRRALPRFADAGGRGCRRSRSPRGR